MVEKIRKRPPTRTLPVLQQYYHDWRRERGLLDEGALEVGRKLLEENLELVTAIDGLFKGTKDRYDVAGEAADTFLYAGTLVSMHKMPLHEVLENNLQKPAIMIDDLEMVVDSHIIHNGIDSLTGIGLSMLERSQLVCQIFENSDAADPRFIADHAGQIIFLSALIIRHLGLPIEEVIDGKLLRNEIKYNKEKLLQLRQAGLLAQGAMTIVKKDWNVAYDKLLMQLQLGDFEELELES